MNEAMASFVEISTHAPARGATRVQLDTGRNWCISTHAPARGATRMVLAVLRELGDFNPRPCTRSDVGCSSYLRLTLLISTHAPARGATHVVQIAVEP